ncbi:MAG: glycosyltransferase family 4 protein [Verrucomicrobiota bacterium]
MARILIVWGLWGPYHCKRFERLRECALQAGHTVTGLALFKSSSVNRWQSPPLPSGVVDVRLGEDEARFPLKKVGRFFTLMRELKPDVALLPSYWHWSLILNLAARFTGARVVLMSDTHAGTARARGLKSFLKARLLRSFSSALVAGIPHRRYFASLGLPEEKIFTGYDAVDNDYFTINAASVRRQAIEFRRKYALPERYFLSLGRFVAKKNLPVLIRAYRKLLDSSQGCQTHLVMVGSGEEESRFKALCQELRLPVYQKSSAGTQEASSGKGESAPGVHFYGFRQVEENPVFYALADAFVLPSLWEEWGLVVNEAMASGLPVIVSETVGCAEDLLKPGRPAAFEEMKLGGSLEMLKGIRQNGFVFDPRSHESLAKALSALASSSALRNVMGASSRMVVENFSCDQFACNALRAARVAMGENPLNLVDPAGAGELMNLDSKLSS